MSLGRTWSGWGRKDSGQEGMSKEKKEEVEEKEKDEEDRVQDGRGGGQSAGWQRKEVGGRCWR